MIKDPKTRWYDRWDGRIIKGIIGVKKFFGLSKYAPEFWKEQCEFCGKHHRNENGWKACFRKHFRCPGCGKRHQSYSAYESCMMRRLPCGVCGKKHRTKQQFLKCLKVSEIKIAKKSSAKKPQKKESKKFYLVVFI